MVEVVINALEELQHRLQAYQAVEQLLLGSDAAQLNATALAVLLSSINQTVGDQCSKALQLAREQLRPR